MKELRTAVEKILWATIEDYCGLWEALWELNTIYPNNSIEKNRSLAKKAIKILVDRGMVKLFFCKEPYGDMIPIAESVRYDDILDKEGYWEAPKEKCESVRASATSSGKAMYKTGDLDHLLPTGEDQ